MIDISLWKIYLTTCFKMEKIFPLSSFAIITAWNPRSKLTSHCLNRTNNQRLQHRLKGYDWIQLLAGDPEFIWTEESIAVEMDLSTALTIGREFEQNAIFYVQDGELWLHACFDMQAVNMGPFAERVNYLL